MNTLADSHIHLFANGFPGAYGCLFPRGQELRVYEAIRRVHHIDTALVVGYEGDPWAAGHNRHIARLAKTHLWMAPIAYCPPAAPPALQQLTSWKKAGHLGLSLYVTDPKQTQLLNRWPTEVLRWLNENRAILSFNIPLALIPRLERFWSRLPDCEVLISHIGLPDPIQKVPSARQARQLLAPLVTLADHAHIGVKLSGYYAVAPYPHEPVAPLVPVLREAFGAERLYWASDFSPALDTVSFPQTISAVEEHLRGAREKRLVMGENLRRLIARVRNG